MKNIKIITLSAHLHFASETFDNIDDIILSMNKKGYDYKGWIPSKIGSYGTIKEIKLIFEKEL